MPALPEAVKLLRARKLLTEQQILTAARFIKDPTSFYLPPTLFRFMSDVLISGAGLEQVEKARGWAPRSAKVLLSQLLFALEETGGFRPLDSYERCRLSALQEELEFLRGERIDDVLEMGRKYDLSACEAQVLLIIKNANGRPVRKSFIHQIIYSGRDADEKIIDVLICKIRKKLRRASAAIEIVTIRGGAVKLIMSDVR